MRPVLLHLGARPLPSYPALLYVGVVLGLAAGNVVANAEGLDGVRIYVATLLLLVPALVGARMAFVAAHWPVYRREPRRIWRRSEGGMVMLGGLPLAVPMSLPLLGALDVDFGTFWDVATITMLVAMVFTRLGCLLNGCCAGRPTASRWAVLLPNTRGEWHRRIPTQLLEAGWAGVLLALAVAAQGRLPDGAIFAGALGAYGSGRLILEPLREQPDGRHLLLAEAAPALAVVCGIGAFWLAAKG
jgi:phosphatidylglycerol---prolipoprotein diacylglyceryl transferase